MNSKQVKEFLKALDHIVEEKGIDRSIVVEAMEQGLAAAYKKNEGIPNVRVEVNPDTGEIKVFKFKNVVEEVQNEKGEISLEDAKKIVPDIEVGETIEERLYTDKEFGRVAAGTAKQVVVQRIKEAEKESVNEEFKDCKDELLVGTLEREDQFNYYVNLGRSFGILPKDEIIPGEKLEMGSSIKAYVSKLEIGPKGPFILLSRSHYGYLKRLLELEIPELSDGTIMLYSVAREAGSRSKIAVYSNNPKVEPIGAIIGEKGSRIGRILSGLSGEKIDVVLYDKDPVQFIKNALSPAKNLDVTITDEKKKEVLVLADKDNLSLAIGKKGQNVRLASRLTHYKLNVQKKEEVYTLGSNEE
mgnify:FL=1